MQTTKSQKTLKGSGYLCPMSLQAKGELKNYIDKADYAQKTFRQIERDFDMSGVEFDGGMGENSGFDHLIEEVYFNIRSLVEENPAALQRLLYRIDVNEKRMQKTMAEQADANLEEVMAYMIVERCLLKVLTREKYST